MWTLTGDTDASKPPAIATGKLSPLPTGELSSAPSTPRRGHPGVARTPSTHTVTQSRANSSRLSYRPSSGSQRRMSQQAEVMKFSQETEDATLGHGNDGRSDSGSEEEPSATARSQALRKPQPIKRPAMASIGSDGDGEDDDEDSSGGYLPFATTSKASKEDPLAATLRSSPKRHVATPQQTATTKSKSTQPPPPPPESSSASSASSTQPPPPSARGASTTTNPSTTGDRAGQLSPQQRAQLAQLSPRHHKKSGSEGSPSMGSSFSDLDDASVTQSALEEALLSNIQHHGSVRVASRVRGIRDALGRK